MKNICFYFQVHQPFRLGNYHFFEIGKHHSYFDEEENRAILKKVTDKCYLPTNRLLLDMISKYKGEFKITFSLSGIVLDQFEKYAPEVIDSFKALAQTGCVEFLSESSAHSLASLISKKEFVKQVNIHSERIYQLFGQYPSVFRNTELIYNNEIGSMVHEMGFDGMLIEGAHHILEWKSPNYLYCSKSDPELKLLLKNFRLSDDIAFRFSNKEWNEWPLYTDKYLHWLRALDEKEEIINLFMDYETFGEHQWESTGIFDFLLDLTTKLNESDDFTFLTPSEAIRELQPIAALNIPQSISWADEQRDLSAWLGNDLQDDAFESLYKLEERVRKCENQNIQRTWNYLQTSDHFYYMCTKYFSDGDVHKYFNPYRSPYEAFINYMNVLSDFEIDLNEQLNLERYLKGRKSRLRNNNRFASISKRPATITSMKE